MHTLRKLFLVVALVVVSASTVQADSLVAVNGAQTADGQTSGSAEEIVAVNITSTGSAAFCGLYDGTSTQALTAAEAKFEAGAAANATFFQQFDSPIRFTSGVQLVCTNAAGVVVYRRRSTP